MPVRKTLAAAALCCGLLALAARPAAAEADQPGCQTGSLPNPAVNCPDRFAWEVFVKVNAPAGNNQLLWQTWATDAETFPCPPTPDNCAQNPGGCPQWPTGGQRTVEPAGHTQRSARLLAAHAQRVQSAAPTTQSGPPASLEIVHRNKPTFDYIVANKLWYVEALADAFENGFVFDFPTEAIEFKSNWNLLGQGDDPSRYVTMQQDGGTYGLVAFHISTKDLPNWFWSTFEHVDNPGRCDYIGCHDSFGYTPADIPTHPVKLGEQYPPGQVTPQLNQWLNALPAVLRNYRLKGSQVDYTTPTGSPIILGNSVTENGFVPTASCITCHGRSTIDQNGVNPYPTVAGLTPDFQSYNGPPRPEWYYSSNNPLRRWAVQTDFVWAIPFKANSVSATAACCQAAAAGTGPPACQN